MAVLLVLISLVVWVALAIIPAVVAHNKGRSFWWFFIFGLLFFLLALIVALVLKPRAFNAGDIVKVSGDVQLTDGGKIPAGWVSKALATDVIDGTYVVQITGPSGATHWVGRGALKPA